MGNNGPVALPPFSSMTIGLDGAISIIPLGGAPNEVALLDRIKMVNPPVDTLRKGDDGMIRSGDGQPLPPDGDVKMATGVLEASNVNSISAMVHMIELSRQFEHYMKLVKVGEDMSTSSASLMRMQS